ncbi:hypothetical protein E4U42_000968, partial [Claviceps africana]
SPSSRGPGPGAEGRRRSGPLPRPARREAVARPLRAHPRAHRLPRRLLPVPRPGPARRPVPWPLGRPARQEPALHPESQAVGRARRARPVARRRRVAPLVGGCQREEAQGRGRVGAGRGRPRRGPGPGESGQRGEDL